MSSAIPRGYSVLDQAINTIDSTKLNQKQKRQNMSNQAEVKKLIAARNWGGFFDALDVNKDGTLAHQEFWKWEKLGSSDELSDALDKFDVSSYFFES